MHSIPLPPFTFMLWGGAAAVFIISVLILLVAKPDEEGHASPLSALVSLCYSGGRGCLDRAHSERYRRAAAFGR